MPTLIVDGEAYEGGPGGDTVLVRANNVTAEGNRGDDWLSTQLYRQTVEGVSLSTDLFGEAGDDILMASMGLVGSPDDYEIPLSISATLDGGAGDDDIWADFNSAFASQYVTVDAGDGQDRVTVRQEFLDEADSGDEMHRSEATVLAGNGKDVISVLLREGGYLGVTGGDIGTLSTIHGSAGADDITSDIASWSGADAENALYGGDGADTIRAIASARADWGGGYAYNRVRGGEGDDRIEMEADTDERAASNSVTGDAGNDTISVLGVTLWDRPPVTSRAARATTG